MSDRIEELQTACNIIEQYVIPDFNHDDTLTDVFNTALSSMKFELEFCFDMDARSQPLEMPEDW